MSDITNHYTYRIRWSEEDGEYVGTCAEFPGLSWLDDSPANALNGIQQVAREAVADMTRDGKNPPEPYSEREYSGRFVVRIPPEEHRELSMEAAEQGVSLNLLVSRKLAKN